MDELDWHRRRWELYSAKRPMRPEYHGPDNRRYNAAGKLIGGHTSRRYACVVWIRKQWARADRRIARAQLRGVDTERGLAGWRTEYNYKGT